MNKLRKILNRENHASETPQIIEIDSETDKISKAHIEERFPEAFKVSKNNVDEYLNIIRQNGGYDVEILVKYHDEKNDKITYFDQHIAKSQIQGLLANLSSEDSFQIHISGKDAKEIISKMHNYSNLISDKNKKESINIDYRGNIIISNAHGLHARPSTYFVTEANMYESEIKLRDTRTGDEANAKSLLSLLMLGAGHGSELEIIANGKDSKKAVDNLIEFSKTNKSFLRD